MGFGRLHSEFRLAGNGSRSRLADHDVIGRKSTPGKIRVWRSWSCSPSLSCSSLNFLLIRVLRSASGSGAQFFFPGEALFVLFLGVDFEDSVVTRWGGQKSH